TNTRRFSHNTSGLTSVRSVRAWQANAKAASRVSTRRERNEGRLRNPATYPYEASGADDHSQRLSAVPRTGLGRYNRRRGRPRVPRGDSARPARPAPAAVTSTRDNGMAQP